MTEKIKSYKIEKLTSPYVNFLQVIQWLKEDKIMDVTINQYDITMGERSVSLISLSFSSDLLLANDLEYLNLHISLDPSVEHPCFINMKKKKFMMPYISNNSNKKDTDRNLRSYYEEWKWLVNLI